MVWISWLAFLFRLCSVVFSLGQIGVLEERVYVWRCSGRNADGAGGLCLPGE